MEQNPKKKTAIILIIVAVVLAGAVAVTVAAVVLFRVVLPKVRDTKGETETVTETVQEDTSEEGAQTTAQAEDPQEDDVQWIALYKDYLHERIKEDRVEDADEDTDEYVYTHFSLIYLDNDTIPELVVSDGFFHAASATLVVISDGELRTFPELGSYGGFQYKQRQGVVVTGYDGSGVSSRGVYRLEQGALNTVWNGSEDHFNEGQDKYFIGDYEHQKEVTEAEYKKQYDANVPNGLTATLVEDACAPLMTSENVEAYFDALEDRDAVPTIRAYTEMTFTGIASEMQTDYYDDSTYYELTLDKPVIVQFEEDDFPSLIAAVRLPDGNGMSPGAHTTAQGMPVKVREFVMVY